MSRLSAWLTALWQRRATARDADNMLTRVINTGLNDMWQAGRNGRRLDLTPGTAPWVAYHLGRAGIRITDHVMTAGLADLSPGRHRHAAG